MLGTIIDTIEHDSKDEEEKRKSYKALRKVLQEEKDKRYTVTGVMVHCEEYPEVYDETMKKIDKMFESREGNEGNSFPDDR